MHIQPKGYKRVPRGSSFVLELERAVSVEAKRFNVSKSFVVAVATAEGLGVKIDFSYKSLRLVKTKKRA